MTLLLWTLVLAVAIGLAHWGANQIANPLEKLRRQWGLSEAAGAAFLAIATASPEVSVNTTCAVLGLSDIGLGNLLGATIISIPLLTSIAYIASAVLPAPQPSEENSTPVYHPGPTVQLVGATQIALDNAIALPLTKPAGFSTQAPLQPTASSTETPTSDLLASSQDGLMYLKPGAFTLQALPYVGVIGLIILLTLPEPWRGLQPIDGWIMMTVYVLYLVQAVVRKRNEPDTVSWAFKEIILSISGIASLIAGAYLIVNATENIISILGISEMVGGLFITSTLGSIPEVFAAWSLARSGQVTTAATSVLANNIATLTLAVFPLALVMLPVSNLPLFSINLTFMALLGIAYAIFIRWGQPEQSISLGEVLSLNGIYLAYLATMIFGVFHLI